MPRFALCIEYNGGPYSGWQRQTSSPSVQATIETALTRIDRSSPSVHGAGRTDAGVHARGQVAHCDLERDWDPFRLTEALNAHLSQSAIAIVAARPVPDAFHARFSATERRYLYRVSPRRARLTLERGLVWRSGRPLDLDLMRQAADMLIGHHDFTTFRSSMCQAQSPMKTLDAITISETETELGPEFHFRLRSRSFLHNQVRSIVGTLERVGTGRWRPEAVGAALAARDRKACGPVAPAEGLYLMSVGYSPEWGLFEFSREKAMDEP